MPLIPISIARQHRRAGSTVLVVCTDTGGQGADEKGCIISQHDKIGFSHASHLVLMALSGTSKWL